MFGSMSYTLSDVLARDEIVFEWFDTIDDLDEAGARWLDESVRNNGRLVNATLVA